MRHKYLSLILPSYSLMLFDHREVTVGKVICDHSYNSWRRHLYPRTSDLSYRIDHRNPNKHFGIHMETHMTMLFPSKIRFPAPQITFGSIFGSKNSYKYWTSYQSLDLKPISSMFVSVWLHCLCLISVSSLYHKAKDDKDKAKPSLKGSKSQKKRRPQETSGRLNQKITLYFQF